MKDPNVKIVIVNWNGKSVLKECFESQDIAKLQEVIKELPEEEARLHMKRCVDSGLWVPSKEDARYR